MQQPSVNYIISSPGPRFHSHLCSDDIVGINSLLLHRKWGHATVGDFRAALLLVWCNSPIKWVCSGCSTLHRGKAFCRTLLLTFDALPICLWWCWAITSPWSIFKVFFFFVFALSGAGESRAFEQDKDCRGRPETEVRHPEAAPVEDKNEILSSGWVYLLRWLLSEQRACVFFFFFTIGRTGACPGWF